MPHREKHYPESRFGGFSDIDGTMAFFTRVNALADPAFVVLDVGCGSGVYGGDKVTARRNLRVLRGKVRRVIGIDVDEAAKDNPYVDDFLLIRDDDWTIDDDSIDLIVCDSVLEHVERPEVFFSEASRVLRVGGYICIRTTNACSYVGLFSKLIPNRYHPKVTGIVQTDRIEEDVFPTLYRCNTIRTLRATLHRHGFSDCVVYGYEAEPSYLSFSRVAYRFGVLHRRFAPGYLRPIIFAFGLKSAP